MKGTDLINLLFNTEESKELQESMFYTQFGIIGAYFKEHYFNEYRQMLTEQLHDTYVQALTMDFMDEKESTIFLTLIKSIAIKNKLNIYEIIN